MAACLVTISGTSGTLKLNYTLSSVAYSIETGIGTLYIESTATPGSITYTTLSGDAIATSSCLTITSAPLVCSTLSWDGNITASGYNANGILIGTAVIPISSTGWPYSGSALISAINNAGNTPLCVTEYVV